MASVYIVFGPQGTGKSLHKKAIAKALGCFHIHDSPEWDTVDVARFVQNLTRGYAPGNHLVLTCLDRSYFADHMTIDHHLLSIDDALRIAGIYRKAGTEGGA